MPVHRRNTAATEIALRDRGVPLKNVVARMERDDERQAKHRGSPQPAGRDIASGHTRAPGGLRGASGQDPRNVFEPPPPTAEQVQAQLRRTVLVPTIISVPCEKHDAEPGEYCFRGAHGVCADRIIARAAKR